MLKKIFILFAILTLSSCSRYWYKPYGRIFNEAPKNGTAGFQLGWLHGCESGLATQFGGAIYQSFYSWKKDADIAKASPTPEDLERVRRRYEDEKIAKIDWNNPVEVKKNFSDYNTIFWGAHIFCRHTVIGQLQMAGMPPPLQGETRYNPSAHSLGNIYKIDGRGDARLQNW